MAKLKGLATGIGSLPHKDVQEALDLVFGYTPQIPFWPQLPKLNLGEGMVSQFMQKIPTEEKQLEEFYEKIIHKDLDYFQISAPDAVGLYALKKRLEEKQSLLKEIEFIKCQITGPFSAAASIKDEEGIAYLHKPFFLQALLKGLMMKALWQLNFFRGFGKSMIIFIDEPYLGCFGSAYTPINREDVVRVLTELSEGIKSKEVLVGVHCCGNTDWSIFTDIEAIEVINFDSFSFSDKFVLYADHLKRFMRRGGIICWGIVPTEEFSTKLTPLFLAEKIKNSISTLEKKGLDKDLLCENLLLSPACGLGTLDVARAEQIFSLLSEVSTFIKNNYV